MVLGDNGTSLQRVALSRILQQTPKILLRSFLPSPTKQLTSVMAWPVPLYWP